MYVARRVARRNAVLEVDSHDHTAVSFPDCERQDPSRYTTEFAAFRGSFQTSTPAHSREAGKSIVDF